MFIQLLSTGKYKLKVFFIFTSLIPLLRLNVELEDTT